MDRRAANDADLMSPPRPVPPNFNRTSTPVRTPRRDQVPGTPEARHGETVRSLTNGDRAKMVLKVKELFYLHKGIGQATENLAIRRANPNQPAYKSKERSRH